MKKMTKNSELIDRKIGFNFVDNKNNFIFNKKNKIYLFDNVNQFKSKKVINKNITQRYIIIKNINTKNRKEDNNKINVTYNKLNNTDFYKTILLELSEDKINNISINYCQLMLYFMLNNNRRHEFDTFEELHIFLRNLMYPGYCVNPTSWSSNGKSLNENYSTNNLKKLRFLKTKIDLKSEKFKSNDGYCQEIQALKFRDKIIYAVNDKSLNVGENDDKLFGSIDKDIDSLNDKIIKFKGSYSIDEKKGMHAEIILLAYLINSGLIEKKRKIYIIGKKLPCDSCRRIINATILATDKLKLFYARNWSDCIEEEKSDKGSGRQFGLVTGYVNALNELKIQKINEWDSVLKKYKTPYELENENKIGYKIDYTSLANRLNLLCDLNDTDYKEIKMNSNLPNIINLLNLYKQEPEKQEPEKQEPEKQKLKTQILSNYKNIQLLCIIIAIIIVIIALSYKYFSHVKSKY